MSSCVKQVRLVMLINFCLLHLQCLGSLRWLSATASSERATSSLSGAGGNLLHTSNWTKCLSNSQPSYTDQIIIQTRCQQRFFTSLFPSCSLLHLLVDFQIFFPVLCSFLTPCRLVARGIISLVLQINYKKVHLLFLTLELLMYTVGQQWDKRHLLKPQVI